jgi:fluoroacetyl-CoA thioesterase
VKPGLKSGDKGPHRMTIGRGDTVPRSFSTAAFQAMPGVFATAYLVGLMEWACVEQLRPYYEDGEGSLGTHVDVSHRADPAGQVVTVETEVDGDRRQVRVVPRPRP